MDTKSLESAVAALHYPSIEEKRADRAAHLAAVQAYRTEERRLRDEWQAWLATEYAPAGLSKAQTDKIFAKAWEYAHSEGYHAIEQEYESLCDFLRAYLEA